jgi:hypothetical protein
VDREKRRGPSFSLMLAGALSLLVSAWAIVGPGAWPAHHNFPGGWIVLAAIVIGIAMTLSPRRRRRR